MRMKIDEAEREGDSFHQQVCQMKLRDKSLVEGAWCLPGSAPAPSVSCLRQPGDEWLQLRPAAAPSNPLPCL